ncbi:hypothetical protein QE152_g32084 [Popillia japonica]|uniref:Uncharacterized protein n=1 Tax=Popillia japonica TaxID=7064 RepID=A0AAW1J0X5_POPJA
MDLQVEDPNVLPDDIDNAQPPILGGDFKMPSQEELLQMIEGLNMSDTEKQEIKDNIFNNIVKRVQQEGQNVQPRFNYLIVIGCVLFMIFLFAFFGYKLYRSQTEKERKREEKRKQKQQKKKHKS